MLHLNFAPSLDLLVPVLIEKIRAVWSDPFNSPTVIVPSPALGKWVTMQLAQPAVQEDSMPVDPFGCVANLYMPTLERYLWNNLKPDTNMQMLDVSHLQQVICALLERSLLEQAIYHPLHAYLMTSGATEPDPLKRVQLSAGIAHQFMEYEYNRPGVWDEHKHCWRLKAIDAKWLTGEHRDGALAEHEAWQMDLYRKAHECLSRSPADDSTRYISLPHLYRLRRENAPKQGAPWTVPQGNLFLFGLTKVSHFHRNILVEISQMTGVEMEVFLTNPCAEFWEDVNTRRSRTSRRTWDSTTENAAIVPRSPEDYHKEKVLDFAHLEPDHQLLQLWGDAGKENIFLWCPQAQWHFEYYSPGWAESDGTTDTLLKTLQKSLLLNNTLALSADTTLQVLACPDRGREIEEIRENILDLVHENKIDRLNEVVVYLPSPDAYVPFIQRVFGTTRPGNPDHIPFTILGASGSDSILAQGVAQFLNLVEGRFDRATVFELLRNPIVQSSRSINSEQVAVWESWAQGLGIYRGFNRAHRELMGDKGETITDAHTFETGMARMLIGGLSTEPVAMDFKLQGDSPALIHPFRDFETNDADTLEMFCAMVDELHNDTTQLCKCACTSLSKTIDLLAMLVKKWFGTIAEDTPVNVAAESSVCREFLESLLPVKLQNDCAGRQSAPLRELIAHIKNSLPVELSALSTAWTGGITFAPLKPSMIVPHKVIFVAGLDALAFPGTSDHPAWDLLSGSRIVGDSDPVRDNRFAFLEVVHAARERLILSYRSRDMQKEEVLQPSSVVLELEAYLHNNGVTGPQNDTRECAIHRIVPWIIHESLESSCRAGRAHGTWDPVERELAHSADTVKKLDHRHDLPGRPAIAVQPGGTGIRLHISLYDIRKFYANPLEYHLAKTLGIEIDEEPATMGATDEPLDSGNLALSTIQKKIWAAVLAHVFPADSPAEVIDSTALTNEAVAAANSIYDQHLAQGQAPEAQFGKMEKHSLIHWARECCGVILELKERFTDHRLMTNSDLSLGREGMPGTLPVALENATCTIECRHPLALIPRLWNNADTRIGIINIKKKGEPGENPDLWLAGIVQWLAEQNNQTGTFVSLIQLNRGDATNAIGFKESRMKKQCDDGMDITGWFCTLLSSMLINRCSDHLPFQIIQKLTKDRKKEPIPADVRWAKVTGDAIDEKLSDEEHGYQSFLESFTLADGRRPAITDAKLQQLARTRFEPMVEGWIHE